MAKTINEMKNDILKRLATKYQKQKTYSSCDANAVENRHFMLAEHAKAISAVCKKCSISVSFREAGKSTLERIKKGNPCKGHEIMDKSIKLRPENKEWTYKAPAGVKLEDYEGLVGHPEGSGNVLKEIWKADTDTQESKQESKQKLVSIGDLTPDDLSSCYTGDYDMHDLFWFRNGRYVRIIAGTPDEHSTIDRLNYYMLEADTSGRKNKVVIGKDERYWNSEYSLIRHGAQTSFMCYLHTITGSKELENFFQNDTSPHIPHENSIMKISYPICMFDKEGKIFILDDMEKIYWYYKETGMLQHIPFYFFFDLLRDNNPKWDEYSQAINDYLKNFCGLK